MPSPTHCRLVRGSKRLECRQAPAPIRCNHRRPGERPQRSAFATTDSARSLVLPWHSRIDAHRHLTWHADWVSPGSTWWVSAPRSFCLMTEGRRACMWRPERLRYRAATVACRRGDIGMNHSPFIAALTATPNSLRELRISRSEAQSKTTEDRGRARSLRASAVGARERFTVYEKNMVNGTIPSELFDAKISTPWCEHELSCRPGGRRHGGRAVPRLPGASGSAHAHRPRRHGEAVPDRARRLEAPRSRRGGTMIVQDEGTSEFVGMPSAAFWTDTLIACSRST